MSTLVFRGISTFYCSSIALILHHFLYSFLLLITYIRFYFHYNLDGTLIVPVEWFIVLSEFVLLFVFL